MLRRSANGADHRVLAIMLHPHQSKLPDLADLVAPGGEDDNWATGARQCVGFASIRGFVTLNLLPHPATRAGLVLPCQRHSIIIDSRWPRARRRSRGVH